MSTTVRYVVQPFRKDGRRLVAGDPRNARAEDDARRIARSVSVKAIGVVAYSIEVDTEGNPVGEPRIIETIGTVPETQS